ncbi:hypothetical protein GYA49_03965, partial [Candidatus Beckwithbacteria bacterium]|nr:hypothetical protein [Candidatus Beckwithbacteria bacterium]
MSRTLTLQTPELVGQEVTLNGWVNTIRDHGKVVFIELRDRSGKVQVVGDSKLGKVHPEDVLEIHGLVAKRPDNMINPNLPTGEVEVQVKGFQIINKSKELPFPIDTSGHEIAEELRLKYRYLDLRRPRLNAYMKLRSKVAQFLRNELIAQDFVETETPMLTKTTPEGARDFLVPSRLQPGKFYALPQSPQQYKQMLMVAGLERYFQFARCFRDEDARADRAYGEFTQLDIEMSFVTQEDILQLIEAIFTKMVETLFPDKHISQSPWPRLSHHEVMEKYGTDKPDLRQNKNDPNELAFAWTLDFPLFTEQSEDDFFHGSGSAKFAPSHHMFTAPHPDDIPLLDTDPTKVRGLQHDLVLNGYEVGGGSIRIHQPEIQQKIFDLIGFSKAQSQQFEHLLTAFQYGVPPHGGIAPGFDRLLMVILGEPNLREVMAFPCATSGITAVVNAPSQATDEQLKELGVQVRSMGSKPAGSIFEQIKNYLETEKVAFEIFEHEPVFTCEQAIAISKTKPEENAKALLLEADGQAIMTVLSADKKLDLKALRQITGKKDVSIGSKELLKKATGLEPGSVPPFGSLWKLPTYLEEGFS